MRTGVLALVGPFPDLDIDLEPLGKTSQQPDAQRESCRRGRTVSAGHLEERKLTEGEKSEGKERSETHQSR